MWPNLGMNYFFSCITICKLPTRQIYFFFIFQCLILFNWEIILSTVRKNINLNFHFNFRYNGFLPQGDRGRRRSKFVLYKRTEPNGVKRSKHYIVQSPQTSKAILDTTQHSISYTLSRNQAVIVEYKEDSDTDMFQVSRTITTIKSL